ncbi:hypothetical protein C8J56DRAFT_1020071 [Mycena floridula]|nr:hypothetical protein C8J56DRAFT_1020071 [Mycena floridula]
MNDKFYLNGASVLARISSDSDGRRQTFQANVAQVDASGHRFSAQVDLLCSSNASGLVLGQDWLRRRIATPADNRPAPPSSPHPAPRKYDNVYRPKCPVAYRYPISWIEWPSFRSERLGGSDAHVFFTCSPTRPPLSLLFAEFDLQTELLKPLSSEPYWGSKNTLCLATVLDPAIDNLQPSVLESLSSAINEYQYDSANEGSMVSKNSFSERIDKIARLQQVFRFRKRRSGR